MIHGGRCTSQGKGGQKYCNPLLYIVHEPYQLKYSSSSSIFFFFSFHAFSVFTNNVKWNKKETEIKNTKNATKVPVVFFLKPCRSSLEALFTVVWS